MIRCLLSALLVLAPLSTSRAQAPVPVGRGSYAESPPLSAGAAAAEMAKRRFPLVGAADRPIPTNKLWTWLLHGKASGALWMYPWRVDPKETGLELHFPTRYGPNGSDPVCDAPLTVEGIGFRSNGLLVKDWGDWTLSFRLPRSETEHLDVTVGEGMPFVWVESRGVELALKIRPGATFSRTGGAAAFPFVGDRLVIAAGGSRYGVFVAPGTRFVSESGSIRLSFPRGGSFAAFAALGDPKDDALFARSAYSVPRDSRMDWTFDPARGKVQTVWTVRTESLLEGKPASDVVLQGWLAHHWRGASHSLPLDGPRYLTPRGPLKTSAGNRFELVYDFEGVLPVLPAPARLGLAHDFDPERMNALLGRRARNPKYGDDTYWGGKDVLGFAQSLAMARELKAPARAKLRDEARAALADWLSYTPGEAAHYFTRYANWHALIGVKDSYDSARFNDQHFHYGYYTYAVALLAMEDPEFLKEYGAMIRLVAKQYANWDRDDARFPFLRTFDVWAGHSWAGGLGSPGGNNQESTSEAMQSWIGLYLLGTVLDDPKMTAAGAMGYAVESRATMEYWFDAHGDLLPKEYKHPLVGVLWSGGPVYGTYFSGDPCWIYGIQCLPPAPGLDYLARDPEAARATFRNALRERKAKEGSDDLATMGDLGNVLLAHASLVDPEWTAGEFDRLWDAKNGIVHEHLAASTTYYQAHSYRRLGRRLWDVRLSVPTSAVYFQPGAKTTTYVVYNPKPYPVVVEASRGSSALGAFVAAPRQLSTATQLQPLTANAGPAATLPADGERGVDRRLNRIYAVFRQPIDPATLSGVRLEGKNAPAVSCEVVDEGRVVVGTPAGPLTPGASYRWTLPKGLKRQDGRDALTADRTIAFTLEPQPPLALETTVPADGQDHVDTTDPEFLLSFNAPIDPGTLGRIRLKGPKGDDPGLKAQTLADGSKVKVQTSALAPDATYSLIVPSGVASVFGDVLKADHAVRFSTRPDACPPNVYRESFAGGGYSAEDSLEVDLRNAESPHSGSYAIKLHAPKKGGSIYFFAGTSDHGDGRKPADLSPYQRIEFWAKGTADELWVKIGHPVFDDKAFIQTRLEKLSPQYRRYAIEVPSPKKGIGTLLAISVPAGGTVYLDDVRFVGAGGPRGRPPRR